MTKARDLANLGAVAASNQTLRNKIINGNFDIWQRATSYSGVGAGYPSNAYGYYAADRWWAQVFGGSTGSGSATFSMSQQAFTLGQTAVPGEPKCFMRYQASGLGTQGGTGSIIRTSHRIEGVRTFAGQTATLSFWAKADSNRTYAVVLAQSFGTGGSPSALTAAGQATFNVTSSWQKITLTFNVPSIAGKTLGTSGDDNLSIDFVLYKQDNTVSGDTLGAIGTWSTTPYLDLSQVQFEAGTVATPFEFRPIGTELALCQRYCVVYGGDSVYERLAMVECVTTTASNGTIPLPATMRTVPSITVNSASNFAIYTRNTIATCTLLTAQFSSSKVFTVEAQVASGLTVGSAGQIVANNTTNARLTLSAEL